MNSPEKYDVIVLRRRHRRQGDGLEHGQGRKANRRR